MAQQGRGGLIVGRTVAVVIASLGLFAASATPAGAYVVGGSVWPGGVIRYYNADRGAASEVAAAVKAWNHSGAHVHFVAVPPSRAAVTIAPWPKHPTVSLGDAAGFASLGKLPSGALVLGPGGLIRGAHMWLRAVNPSAGLDAHAMTLVAAHELGHVLGLNHSTRCATMDATTDILCKQPRHGWQYICRVLQPDDVAGAIARYGGHARPVGPQYCSYFGPPAPPTKLATTLVPAQSSFSFAAVKVTWKAPKGVPFSLIPGYRNSVAYYEVFAAPSHCSTAGNAAQALAKEKPGATTSTKVFPDSPGRWCIAVETLDLFSRPGKAAYVWVTIPGAPPLADFSDTQNETDGLQFDFTDASTASGPIARYAWNFGDPSSKSDTSTQQNPSHDYSAAGTYTVTETVTDTWGQANTASQNVTVADYTSPTAQFDDGCSTDGQCSLSTESPFEVAFNDDSYDDDGAITSWSWTFGDPTSGAANTSTAEFPVHDYAAPGTYTVTLTIIDEHGKSSTTHQTVAIDS